MVEGNHSEKDSSKNSFDQYKVAKQNKMNQKKLYPWKEFGPSFKENSNDFRVLKNTDFGTTVSAISLPAYLNNPFWCILSNTVS